jgi:CspA family cold shock protein
MSARLNEAGSAAVVFREESIVLARRSWQVGFMVTVGTILRFDDTRGYGFIEPADGTEDVFVHANDFGESRHMVRAGLRVQYEVVQSNRGPKVATVSLLGPAPESPRSVSPPPSSAVVAIPPAEDEEVCGVLSAKAFSSAIIELLVEHVPTLTGTQIGEVRHHITELARLHGWVDG